MAVKSYSLLKGLYASGVFFLAFMNMLGMVVVWTHLLRGLIRQIDVHADSTLEFKTRLGRTVLTPREIKSIELETTEDGIATHITHEKGRLSISEQMGDISELVSFLKSRNPRIEVTGAAS